MQNVEYKAELRDIELARSICRRLKARHVGLFDQTDTYYRVPDARLKKRQTVGQPTEYIFYNRPDKSAPKVSRYVVYTEREATERFGRSELPVWVVVKKRRDLYMLDNIRIHLDQVEGLGNFLEFEALVSPRRNAARCSAALSKLRDEFSGVLGEPISGSYSDLLGGDFALS
jgi:adenylate cyclase class IV